GPAQAGTGAAGAPAAAAPQPAPAHRLPRLRRARRDHGGTGPRPAAVLPVRRRPVPVGVVAGVAHPLAAHRDRGVPLVALRPLAPPVTRTSARPLHPARPPVSCPLAG